MIRRVNLPLLGLVLLITPTLDASVPVRVLEPGSQANEKQVVLRGRASCVESNGKTVPDDSDCSIDSVKFTFHSKDGKIYTFVPDDALTAMLTDHRVRRQELQLTAWERRKDQIELIAVQSAKNGKLYDVFYYCDVCNITAYAPGPCPCCRRELEFKEAPATEP
jgi:hypothetical protein